MSIFNLEVASFAMPKHGRTLSQDHVFAAVDGSTAIIAVADGIGGRPGGREASKIAIDVVRESWDYTKTVEEAVFENIVGEIKRFEVQHDLVGMGTTLSVGLLSNRNFSVLHVGDCIIYQLRHQGIKTLTLSQTEFDELVRKGVFDKSFKMRYRRRNVLVSALTSESNFEVFRGSAEVNSGDRFLAVSDGVKRIITSTDIRDNSLISKDAQTFLDMMKEKIESNNPPDDFAAAAIFVE